MPLISNPYHCNKKICKCIYVFIPNVALKANAPLVNIVTLCPHIQTMCQLNNCNTLVVNPHTYDPSCDLCSFALWTYDILYDCGLMLLCIINLIKEYD